MADVPTVSWDETKPAGTRDANLGDNDIREMKTQIRQVIDVDHDFPSSGNASDVGQHKKVTLQEQADLGTGAEGVPIFGSQTCDGKAELVFTDEDDNDTQMTSGGNMGSATTNILCNNITISGTASGAMPSGMIVLWSGSIASIPSGWVLCDGSNSTPDLRDRFVVGAGTTYSVADTGGEAAHTLTEAELPAHTHPYYSLYGANRANVTNAGGNARDGNAAENTSGSVGSGDAHENRPPYYALAYIMKS